MRNIRTSKMIAIAAVLGLLTACSETTTEKETIIVPAEVAVEKPVVVEVEEASNSTSVTVGEDGIKVDAPKLDVEIKK